MAKVGKQTYNQHPNLLAMGSIAIILKMSRS